MRFTIFIEALSGTKMTWDANMKEGLQLLCQPVAVFAIYGLSPRITSLLLSLVFIFFKKKTIATFLSINVYFLVQISVAVLSCGASTVPVNVN